MNCRILHELPGRLRVHMCQCHMTLQEADILEAYLKKVDGVAEVRVYERTADAVIRYNAEVMQSGEQSPEKETILRALASFDYDRVSITPP